MRPSINRGTILQILQDELPYLRARFGIVAVGLYGSFARGTATESSDVDLLVELARPLGFEFVALADHLESVLGRKVGLATYETLERGLLTPRYRPIALSIQETLTDVRLDTR